jgi:ABC-type nitrate/sulfonate/bicarbonate transport system permease component
MRNLTNTRLTGVALISAAMLIIELLVFQQWLDPVYVPRPSVVLQSLGETMASGELPNHIRVTLSRAITAYAIAVLIGVPFGILIGESKIAFNLFDPLIQALRPMPSSAIIPVAILFLGIGDSMRLFVIAFASVWPVLVAAADAVKRVDPVLVETGRMLNLSRRQIALQIALPASAPTIFTGMRIGFAIALILSLTVEMIAGGDGLGFFILDAERSFQFAKMFAGILTIGVIGFLTNSGFSAFDRRVLRWHHQSVRREIR